ncbi:carbohydrate ABC transporter permease [Kosmotoga olearia]|uniref:Binding-protein-dependent transport systems inner membrane component n=1 Tax=Kosmotoga olearia (strain ATCC BAA-1733 / DSM 21960 / TBF 19.5.1) TaxID=521045 RepID=C5CIL0_KOSOT|nr:sugar ABC transporter permease [Kosmotoga olearia]ACR79872.1 binding-protein-dependent transport systems inner membrane component [Kosmotoga olearia TBF 19.5.1]
MKKYSRERRETQLGMLFVIPSLIVIALVIFFPIGRTFYLSLFKYNLKFPRLMRFIGLGNYMNLFQDDRFWNSVKVTLSFTFTAVAFETVLGILIALVINKNFKGRGIVRAATLVPWAIPTVASAQMWRMMFSDQFGVINDIFMKLGIISEYVNFIGKQPHAFWAMVAADVWKTTPFMALLLLAGLQVIPMQIYEAAKVDGANKWKQFWSITLPMLKPTILVALIFRTLDTFKAFDISLVLTNGGPASSTELLSLYNYKIMIQQLNFGKGSAIAIVLFAFTMLIAFFFIKILGANPYSSGK